MNNSKIEQFSKYNESIQEIQDFDSLKIVKTLSPFKIAKRKKYESTLQAYELSGNIESEKKFSTIVLAPFVARYKNNGKLAILLYTANRKLYDIVTINYEASDGLDNDCAFINGEYFSFLFFNKLGKYYTEDLYPCEIINKKTKELEVKKILPLRFDLSQFNTLEQLKKWLGIIDIE